MILPKIMIIEIDEVIKKETIGSFLSQLLAPYNLFDSVGFSQSNQRPKFAILLVQDLGIPKMVCQLKGSLVAGIANIADFGRPVPSPFLKMKLFIERFEVRRFDKVDKSVANIAVILSYKTAYIFIDWKIKKVKLLLMIDTKLLQQHLLTVLIGDVLDHYGSSPIPLNIFIINYKIFAFLLRH